MALLSCLIRYAQCLPLEADAYGGTYVLYLCLLSTELMCVFNGWWLVSNVELNIH